MNIEELKKEYAEQDNRGTAYPIYVTVQELVPVVVPHPDYSACGDTEVEYDKPNCDVCDCETEDCNQDMDREKCHAEKVPMVYVWQDVEIFLTIKGAEEYIKLNKHNLNKPRTYVKWISHKNKEMRDFLEQVGFKVKE